jgi:hypothetical protein
MHRAKKVLYLRLSLGQALGQNSGWIQAGGPQSRGFGGGGQPQRGRQGRQVLLGDHQVLQQGVRASPQQRRKTCIVLRKILRMLTPVVFCHDHHQLYSRGLARPTKRSHKGPAQNIRKMVRVPCPLLYIVQHTSRITKFYSIWLLLSHNM